MQIQCVFIIESAYLLDFDFIGGVIIKSSYAVEVHRGRLVVDESTEIKFPFFEIRHAVREIQFEIAHMSDSRGIE